MSFISGTNSQQFLIGKNGLSLQFSESILIGIAEILYDGTEKMKQLVI